jgi:hypothetical protein
MMGTLTTVMRVQTILFCPVKIAWSQRILIVLVPVTMRVLSGVRMATTVAEIQIRLLRVVKSMSLRKRHIKLANK